MRKVMKLCVRGLPGIVLGGALALGFALGGCAIADYGTLAGRYTYTPDALVLDVYSVGAQVRTLAKDRGATLGFRRSTYIIPAEEGTPFEPKTEWRWGHVPHPAGGDFYTQANRSVGLELQNTPHLSQIVLGYHDQVLTLGPGPGESWIYILDYDREHPENTRLLFCKKGDAQRCLAK